MERVFSRIRAGRALLIRIGALGDVLLTRRLAYALSLTGLRSTLLAPERHASLLRADPWIEDILDSESPRLAAAFAGEWPGGAGSFERAVLISESEALAMAVGRASSSTLRVPSAPWRDDLPIWRQWCDAAGVPAELSNEPVPRLETDRSLALAEGATLIHPGSGAPRKNWPVERFVELSMALKKTGHRVMWIRGPAETVFPAEASRFAWIDRAPLAALAATLARSRLFVGNDSGVAHLAAAAGAPTLSLFGPTSHVVWKADGPFVSALPAGNGDLRSLETGRVLAAIEELARLPGLSI